MTLAPDQRLRRPSLIARCSNPRSANPAPLGLVKSSVAVFIRPLTSVRVAGSV